MIQVTLPIIENTFTETVKTEDYADGDDMNEDHEDIPYEEEEYDIHNDVMYEEG